MTELHQGVKEWLHTQKDWLQQAAELLLTKGALEDQDFAALTEYVKTAEGQAVTSTRAFAGLMAGAAQAGEVRLKSVGEITGIDNLGPSNPLDFGVGNLCVIYGNNGSGKSGYSRLIKKAAGKPSAKDLKQNVFQPVLAQDQRKAKIVYAEGGVEHTSHWVANDAGIPALQAVDIFDTDLANTYLTQSNTATYTPPLVSLFEQLVFVASKVKERLQAQQDALVSAKPAMPPEYLATAAGGQYNGLRHNTPVAEIRRISTWTEAEEQDLANVAERLAAADPAALARQKRAIKAQIEQVASKIKEVAPGYSAEALNDVRAKRQSAQDKRKIAQEAARVQSAKLDGVGTATWKALWEAARAYSQTPYPQQDFPVVDDAARCVLCHQDLAKEAKQRLKDFEKFVQGDVEQAANMAETALANAMAQFVAGLSEAVVVQNCQSAGLDDEALIEDIKTFWRDIAASRAAMVAGELVEVAMTVASPHGVLASLELRANALEEQAKQHDQDANGFNRAEATQKKANLEAKKWTSQQAVAIAAELTLLKQREQYESWKRLLSTGPITAKGSDVAEKAITDAYVARFNSELGALKAKRIKVKLVKLRAERGKALHGLQLEGSADGSAKPDQILSEGERRIISLAAFLADVAEKPHASTFIFDDPISSLDQDFEHAVAERLVQLAKTRQVLVFTHRLSLYGLLEDAGKKMGDEWKKTHYEQRCIETFSNVAGMPVAQPIWASKTEPANNTLLSRLATAKKAGEENGGEAYRALAQGICSDFRKLLERTVESDLLNEIVLRQRRGIQTDGRLSKLSVITPEDLKYIDALMTKFSGFEHSQSPENPIQIPEEPDLRKDLEGLRDWRKGFKDRQAPGIANV
ncbi:restriction endonuclease [Dyella jiangningensis]|nr:restriction endonuclease [Dyella jiangningensis]AHX15951.1 restriction endonuclease [Dyella jiangningensis]